MKSYPISLPTKPTEITMTENNQGYIWFKHLDLSIDFTIDETETIKPKQFWITGNNLIELEQVPFLSEWIQDVIAINRKEILMQFNNLIQE